jgi:hypothetical protein
VYSYWPTWTRKTTPCSARRPAYPETVEFIICGQEEVARSKGMRTVTATDTFPDR